MHYAFNIRYVRKRTQRNVERINNVRRFIELENIGTSLVAQWLRIRLPTQGTRV